jgi:hypothetical protein
MTFQPSPDQDLPPYLRQTEPLELEDLPLQVSLLTMEIATLRQRLTELAKLATLAAMLLNPPQMPNLDLTEFEHEPRR